jgi:hypothetical protein
MNRLLQALILFLFSHSYASADILEFVPVRKGLSVNEHAICSVYAYFSGDINRHKLHLKFSQGHSLSEESLESSGIEFVGWINGAFTMSNMSKDLSFNEKEVAKLGYSISCGTLYPSDNLK